MLRSKSYEKILGILSNSRARFTTITSLNYKRVNKNDSDIDRFLRLCYIYILYVFYLYEDPLQIRC